MTGCSTPAPRTKRHSKGYVLQWAPDHPWAQKTGYVPQHRLIMEQVLGRHLLPLETVHHKNGVRDDNRPDNLEVWYSGQPAGQRPGDLVRWAVALLKLYRPDLLTASQAIL